MSKPLNLWRNPVFLPLTLSVLTVSALYWYQGDKGFSLWDEGFLWYGVQRVIQGEVPIRDFLAYDPGRYYWCAWLMKFFLHDDILSLRLCAAAFQAIGLFVGLNLLVRNSSGQKTLFLLLSTFVLLLWMFPYFKAFDITLSILLIATLAFLAENPTRRRFFISGLCLGLIALFGRNHGIYGVAGTIVLLVWLKFGRRKEATPLASATALWGSGVLIGYAPILCMALLIPGFAGAFWESILFLFQIGGTNLPLPVPWPWTVNFTALTPVRALRAVCIGIGFIGLLLFGVTSLFWIFRQRHLNRPIPPALLATSILALPYAHYAFSRADITHLAMGIFPLLLGTLLLLSTQIDRFKWPLILLLCVFSFAATRYQHIWLKYHSVKHWVDVDVAGNILKVDQMSADDVNTLKTLADTYAPDGQNIFAAPFWPGAYALLQRKSPTWEIYSFYRQPAAFEKREIERIKEAQPSFVIITDIALDGRDDLRFRNTHPLINSYIEENYQAGQALSNPSYKLFLPRRK